MIECTIVDGTGEVVKSLALGSEDDILLNVADGEFVILGSAPIERSWWDFELSAWQIRPTRPGDNHVWDPINKDWTDPRTLDDLKVERWEAIKQAREFAKVAPTMITPYGIFDAHAAAVQNVKDALMGRREAERLAGAPLPPIIWTLAGDGDPTVEITTDQLAEVGVLLLSRGDAAHQTARELRARIDAATSAAELDAIAWPA